MPQPAAPTALLCMPPGEARNAVRAALMAMKVVPQDILPSRTELAQLAGTLRSGSRAVAIIDLAGIVHAAAHPVALAALLPDPGVRQRTLVVRPHRGLWPTDRTLVQELGFADLAAQLDAISLSAEPANVLDWVARCTGVEPLKGDALARYFSAMQVKPDAGSARGLVRKATGLTAEALCADLASNVKALNRVYRLKSYPSCFLGTEAVAWLAKQHSVSTDQAVAIGVALQSLGMLHHVAHEHTFANEDYFYRTAVSTAVERAPLGALLKMLSSKSGVSVRDRIYHGKTYAQCFIGSEAVDWVKKSQKIANHEAEILLNRLHAFNFIEHVARDHPVRDGMFYYRFVA